MAASFALLPVLAWGQTAGRQQYISDNISVTIREAPRNDAASIGAVSSGAKVTVLESLGSESFARIRTADGRTGWVTARLVSSEPAAKDQLQAVQKQLTEAKAQIAELQANLSGASERLEKAKPAFEMADDNERLRATLAEQEKATQAMQSRYDVEKARRRTLVTGAALVGGGVLLGLLLPWMGRGKRRRSDF